MLDNFTIAILARHQSNTLRACLQSAIATECTNILILCDDDDATKQVLDDMGIITMSNITIHYIKNYHNVGQARQQALSYINTDYFMWLDGDDMITSNLPQAYMAQLYDGYDVVYSDVIVRNMRDNSDSHQPVPKFLKQPQGHYYEIERHWCVAGSAIAMRTNIAKQIGYDIHSNAEDYLFKLNAFLHHARIGFAEYGHYIYCRYDYSNSFWQYRQQSALRAGLLRLDHKKLCDLLDNNAYFDDIYTSWAKSCLYQRCGFYDHANAILHPMFGHDLSNQHIGYGLTYQFLYYYMLGANNLLMGNEISAQHYIEQALDLMPDNINALNNLGLCYYWQNYHEKAQDIWHHIIQNHPNYNDALFNYNAIMCDNSEQACAITALPFRGL